MRSIAALVLLCLSTGAKGQTVEASHAATLTQAFPTFLPSYFLPEVQLKGENLHLVEHSEKEKTDRYLFSSEDQVVSLSIERLACENAICATIYDNAARFLDKRATDNGGRFKAATDTEMRVDWQSGLTENSTFVFKLPGSLIFWTYGFRLDRGLDLDERFAALTAVTDRQRYEEALTKGNVEVGGWDLELRRLAIHYLKLGKKSDALPVLKDIVLTAPSDYEAQMIFAETTDDAAAARNSARAVLDNAEDQALVTRARLFLGMPVPDPESIPFLAEQERGLQVIFIPLPPCDAQLLDEAAKIFGKITNIPVKIARLHEDWTFGRPDRIPDQKAIQQTIVQQEGPGVDFAGWTQNRYATELLQTVSGKDALARFSMEAFVAKLPNRAGQYLVDAYLNRLIAALSSYRSTDRRTMYVGVTEANIYSGDNNYLFSQYSTRNNEGGSILSYAMMMTKMTNEPYESRKRLAERLAKEMVPASFKSLGIPRPADPSDPYSYSDGVARLAQKTLTLSAPTREALDKLR